MIRVQKERIDSGRMGEKSFLEEVMNEECCVAGT